MKRRVIQTGSSLAVTLPNEVVEEFKIKKGQELEVSVHPVTGAVVILPGVLYVEGGKVTRRFNEEMKKLLARRAALYRELAK